MIAVLAMYLSLAWFAALMVTLKQAMLFNEESEKRQRALDERAE
jgi:hypothetical protein